jgi:hypothetical protein
VAWSIPCGGSAELADGISSVSSSVVGPWGTMANGMSCMGGLIVCTVASIDSGWLADVGADVGVGMDFCRFCCASASVKALRFAWASATVGWGASTLAGCGG